ncbi:MAG: hypothetical protein HYZ34_11300 [Ignavibacteriae bacterium]|nr:hypothetical protein [Ignavibacteriota bacterium]
MNNTKVSEPQKLEEPKQSDDDGNTLVAFAAFLFVLGFLIMVFGDSIAGIIIGFICILGFAGIMMYGESTNKFKKPPKQLSQSEIRASIFGVKCPNCNGPMIEYFYKKGQSFHYTIRRSVITSWGTKVSEKTDAYYCSNCRTKRTKESILKKL